MTDPSSDIQDAAAARAHRSLADLEQLDMRALSRLSLSLGDVEARATAREAAIRAAKRAGIGPLLEEARLAARTDVLRAFDFGGFLAIGVDLADSRSRASVDERVALMAAAEDAVIAAVAEPFVSDEIADTLATPMGRLRLGRATAHEVPRGEAGRHWAVTRWSTYVVWALLVLVSLYLLVSGSGIGLFGLAAMAGVALVALVMRGRPLP